MVRPAGQWLLFNPWLDGREALFHEVLGFCELLSEKLYTNNRIFVFYCSHWFCLKQAGQGFQ